MLMQKGLRVLLALAILSTILQLPVGADAASAPKKDFKIRSEEPFFSTRPLVNPQEPKGIFWKPVFSFLLPGFGQWTEGQYGQAAFYSGTALGGMSLAAQSAQNLVDKINADATDLGSRDNDLRNYILGNQLYMASGSFSAFTSFRTAVNTRRASGQYSFLPDENVGDILWAPLEFKYLKRPTTYLPLLVATAIMAAQVSNPDIETSGQPFTASDLGYAGTFSYLAGTNEEALFRGYLMPAYMEAWQSPFWSNMVSSLVFAAAHISPRNRVPWPQFLLGWHFGSITQNDNWSIKEATFLHTWWDVVIFTGSYIIDSQKGREAWIRTPPIQISF